MRKFFISTLLVFVLTQVTAQIKLPRLISNGVILQRDAEVKIWGWASAGENIRLTHDKKDFSAVTGEDGRWEIVLPPQPAGGPHTIIIRGSNEIELSDVLFGDVWVCSGQSNMELTLERVKEKYAAILATTSYDHIRQFVVPDLYDFNKQHHDLTGGYWMKATPEKLLEFSAVAFFFAQEIHDRYKIPVGLINAALGGSPAEAWLSEEAIKHFPAAYNEYQKFQDDALIKEIEEKDRARSRDWHSSLNQRDEGLKRMRWSDEHLNDSDWHTISLPGYWADTQTGNVNGSVWFRKEVIIPRSMTGKPAKLWLGRIVDQDSVFINGRFTGTIGYQYPPRRYNVADDYLREGKNIIAVRVINQSGKGGFVPDKPYYLACNGDTIELKGMWKFKMGAQMPPLEGPTFIRWKPVGLFNKMISPLLNTSIKGVIWYQGESNVERTENYEALFSTLIRDWRNHWGQGDFSFLYVQLANYLEEHPQPTESKWAELRDAQLKTLSVPNTGMAVAIDLGEWNDIHPLNKADVGKRLALLARKITYGENELVASGPIARTARIHRNKVVIDFENADNGLMTRDDNPPRHFAVSSDGNKFYWADAHIENQNVILTGRKVKRPAFVRYAWADNPAIANLYNKDGLPASPFWIKTSD